MGRSTQLSTLDVAARRIGAHIELVAEVTSNPDNVDDGEMLHIQDGTEDGATALTERGIECVEDLIADIRTWKGGIRQFLVDQQCDDDMIERVMADEAQRSTRTGSPNTA